MSLLRHDDINPQAKLGRLKGYADDPELTAQLHQTLADFEANLEGEGTGHNPHVILNWIYIFSLRRPGSPGVHASNIGNYI